MGCPYGTDTWERVVRNQDSERYTAWDSLKGQDPTVPLHCPFGDSREHQMDRSFRVPP